MTGKSGFIGGPTDPFETPDAPEITGVSAGVLSADVTFTAPSDTGGAAIDSYVITAKQGDGTSVAQTASSAGTTSITLTAGGTTTFGAQAFNLYGAGQFSGLGNSTSVFSGNELYSFGYNNNGELGLGDEANRSSPVQVGALTTWLKVSAGEEQEPSSFAIKTDNTLWAWGSNEAGRLGTNNNVTARSSPVQIGALTDWSEVFMGSQTCLAIKTDGTLWAWGTGLKGNNGDGTRIFRSSPVQIGAETNWSQISTGGVREFSHSLALTTSGELYAWGYNGGGRLGLNDTADRSSPVQVGSDTDWVQASAGTGIGAAIKTNGTLWSWGVGTLPQLGQNNNISRSSPVQIGALTNWSQVSVGRRCTSAIKTDGTLWVWGDNQAGAVGDNSSVDRSSPVQIGSDTNWSFTESGYGHTTAVKTDGTLWSWGSNSSGRLGDGTTINRSSPVQIGAETSWTAVSAGKSTLALFGSTS